MDNRCQPSITVTRPRRITAWPHPSRHLAVLVVMVGVFGSTQAMGQTASGTMTNAGRQGVSAADGSLVVYGTHKLFIPRGFNSIGVLYPVQYVGTVLRCHLSAKAKAKLAAALKSMTTTTDQQLLDMKEHWRANTVRFQVSQGALTYEHQHGLSAYTDMVLKVVHQARRMGLVVIVSMQTEGYSCTPRTIRGQLLKLPDYRTEQAWQQLAPSLGRDRGVMLEVFNEPNSLQACGVKSWRCWAAGCKRTQGMVTVGRYLRRIAPDNVLIFDGDLSAGRFTGFPAKLQRVMPTNSAYAVHPYFFNDGTKGWRRRFGFLQTRGGGVVVTEWNEYEVDKRRMRQGKLPQRQTLARWLVQHYLPRHHIGLIFHSWDAPDAAAGHLNGINSHRHHDNVPTGAMLVYKQFWTQAGGRPPAPQVDVSSIAIRRDRLDRFRVVLASNGGQNGVPGPYIARSVEWFISRPGQADIPKILTKMQLSTTAPWPNGSFTVATASGLAHRYQNVKAGDVLHIIVHYEGSTTRQISYVLHS